MMWSLHIAAFLKYFHPFLKSCFPPWTYSCWDATWLCGLEGFVSPWIQHCNNHTAKKMYEDQLHDKNAVLHTWNGRSPVWLSMWTLKVVCRPNCFPHSLQGKFFSPKCTTLMCKSIALFDPYAFPQDPQTKSLMPAWDLRCLFRAPGSRNFWPHNSQGFFCSSICLFSSSVRVPSLILCRRVCRFKPSFWIKPSPHLSHLKN